MKTKIKKAYPLLLISLIIFGLSSSISYGGENMPYPKNASGDLEMSYRLEGSYSRYKYIQIEVLGTGEVKLGYELYSEYVARGQRKADTLNFRLPDAQVKTLESLYEKADFMHLKVFDLNKNGIRITDVGTTTLTYRSAGKERTLSYGYVENNPLKELIQLYWQIAKDYLPDNLSTS